MAERKSNIRFSSNLFEATDDVHLVASILLELRTAAAESEPVPRLLPLSWGAKKKRRSTDETPPQRRLPQTSLPPPPITFTPSLQGSVKAEAASSPATPLSFSLSESDESPKRLKRKVYEKKTVEEWLDTIEKITKSNTCFETEIEKLKRFYEELKAKNLRLKAREQELSFRNRIGKAPRMEASNSNSNCSTDLRFEMKLGQATVRSTPPVDNQIHHLSYFSRITVHQSSVIVNQTATEHESPFYYYYPQRCGGMLSSCTSGSGGGLGKSIDDVGPVGIPDLNLCPVDRHHPWMDSNLPSSSSSSIYNKSFSRAMAAQARHRRMQICRDKNSSSSSSNKLRISFR